MIWHLLRHPLAFVFFFFFRYIRGMNLERVFKPGPALLILNHPSAFTDPIAFTYVFFPLRTRYMARGDVFKNPLAAFFFNQLGIIPIYRIQDQGKEGLLKNDTSYTQVIEALKKGQKVIVFAEGICIQDRRLKPIKKGVARLALLAQQALGKVELDIIPIGVNYTDPCRFRSGLWYHVGEPIQVNRYLQQYLQQPAKAQYELMLAMHQSLLPLVTHVDDARQQNTLPVLEKLYANTLKTPKAFWDKSHQMANALNALDLNTRERLEQTATEYSKTCLGLGILEQDVAEHPTAFWKSMFAIISLGCIAWPGLVIHVPVFWIARRMARRVKHVEFYTSALLTYVLIGGLLWYGVFWLSAAVFFNSAFIGYLFVLLFLISGIICVFCIDRLRMHWRRIIWWRMDQSVKESLQQKKSELRILSQSLN